jgi:1-deoxy-D-xylulose-5-phosphate synthase
MKYLDQINSPADLKQLTIPQLKELAKEVRDLILHTVCKTGGHLASSLGVVELTIAMHYVFDSPKDKMVWDVSHQTYAHKILTGRKDRFGTLRQYGGISGFTKINESEHDVFGAGHSSTSISAALGFAVARDLKKERHEVIAVIGDGALTGGLAYEGLNNVGNLNTDITVILNDNKMSISDNVGAISDHLKKLSMVKIEGKERGDLGTIFGNLNFYYIPKIDGHNLEVLIDHLRAAKDLHGPLLMHVMTHKGEGYKIAECNAQKYHGISAFDLESGGVLKKGDGHPQYNSIFGETLTDLARKDDKIIGITAAMMAGTGMEKFAAEFPHRFFDVGIAEQHALTFSAGLAKEGMKPFAAIYSTFIQRAYDQIIHDIALQKLPVKIMLDRAGLVGEDGPTHHGAFDLSFLRVIPNLVITAPKDEDEFKALMKLAADYDDGPFVIRYPRGASPDLKINSDCNIRIGKNEILRKGDDIMIIAIGTMVEHALKAAEQLEKDNISATVINSRFLKPMDEEIILNNLPAGGNKKILTVEENSEKGGLGCAVMELFEKRSLSNQVQIKIMGIPDKFIEHGKTAILLEKIGLNSDGIYEEVKEMVK